MFYIIHISNKSLNVQCAFSQPQCFITASMSHRCICINPHNPKSLGNIRSKSDCKYRYVVHSTVFSQYYIVF